MTAESYLRSGGRAAWRSSSDAGGVDLTLSGYGDSPQREFVRTLRGMEGSPPVGACGLPRDTSVPVGRTVRTYISAPKSSFQCRRQHRGGICQARAARVSTFSGYCAGLTRGAEIYAASDRGPRA